MANKIKKLHKESLAKKVDLEQAKSLLESINRTVPEDIFNFLVEYNGSETLECKFDNREYTISWFLPFFDLNNPSIQSMVELEKKSENPIENCQYLPFAMNMGGRPYYISINEKDFPIYIFRVGMGFENPALRIADSFYEFINNLTE